MEFDHMHIRFGHIHIKLVIADDHDGMRENIKAFLGNWPDIDIIGEAKDGEAAVEIVKKLSPDIILLDINMPRLNGIEAARNIRTNNPQTRVVILSTYSDKTFVRAGFRAGISGYVLKSFILDDLIPALHAVMANELFVSPHIADTLPSSRPRQRPKSENSVA